MEKAIEIKRRAQRCIQNGDLDGALAEYEKLVGADDADPYNYVLLADLLYKKGEQGEASERYLSAVASYEKASLYKNAIAVCKKMMRLSLSPAKVLHSLAHLHALDGLAGEAALYYVQYAEHMVRSSAPAEAATALRQAFDVCQDNIKVLEQLSEAWLLAGEQEKAAQTLLEAASHYRTRGLEAEAQRVAARAGQMGANPADIPATPPPPEFTIERPAAPIEPSNLDTPEPGAVDFISVSTRGTSSNAMAAAEASVVDGFDSGRHDGAEPAGDAKPSSAEFESPFGPTPASAHAFGDLSLDEPAPAAAESEPVAEIADEPEPVAESEPESVPVYEISEDDAPEIAPPVLSSPGFPPAASHAETDAPVADAVAEPAAEEGVYEISEDEIESATPVAAAPESAPAPTSPDEVYVITDEPEPALENVSPAAPGLAFGAPEQPEAPVVSEVEAGLTRVESLLATAQEQFRTGARDLASATLTDAAKAYEHLGRLDSAATIYRSLGRGAHATPAVMELWLSNCERRADHREAAQVACELGDRALNDGNEPGARVWFERAATFDANNETARRRLQRLAGGLPGPAPRVATEAPKSAEPVGEGGRVEVAVGRAEAVTFDLNGLLAEFQRGVEAQLAGDAQSHYDLGMTYREMGLLEQAVESFRVAERDPKLAAKALEMIGRSHVDQGRWAEAVGEFRRALTQQGLDATSIAELRFHLAHALVDLGEPESALAEYQAVATALPDYEDVNERILALRRVLGQA